jgi:hypothetical protein
MTAQVAQRAIAPRETLQAQVAQRAIAPRETLQAQVAGTAIAPPQDLAGFTGIKGFFLFLVLWVADCTGGWCLHADGRRVAK